MMQCTHSYVDVEASIRDRDAVTPAAAFLLKQEDDLTSVVQFKWELSKLLYNVN